MRPFALPTKPAELACERSRHSSVSVSRPFAGASVEAAATHPDSRRSITPSGSERPSPPSQIFLFRDFPGTHLRSRLDQKCEVILLEYRLSGH